MVESFAYPASIHNVIMFYEVDEDRILLRMFNYALHPFDSIDIRGFASRAIRKINNKQIC
jgi:hypothetical protein